MDTINAVSGDATKRAKFSKVFCPMTYNSKKLLKENKGGRRLAAGDSCTEAPLPSNAFNNGDCKLLKNGEECSPTCLP
jgi:hypothetical protein